MKTDIVEVDTSKKRRSRRYQNFLYKIEKKICEATMSKSVEIIIGIEKKLLAKEAKNESA